MCIETSLSRKIAVKEMMDSFLSYGEIAVRLGISRRTVIRIAAQWDYFRTPEQISIIQSRSRNELVKRERRRVLFGLPTKTRLKVFSNKEKNSIRSRLKRKGYILSKDCNVYFDENTKRKQEYEEKGRKLGLRFHPISEKEFT